MNIFFEKHALTWFHMTCRASNYIPSLLMIHILHLFRMVFYLDILEITAVNDMLLNRLLQIIYHYQKIDNLTVSFHNRPMLSNIKKIILRSAQLSSHYLNCYS